MSNSPNLWISAFICGERLRELASRGEWRLARQPSLRRLMWSISLDEGSRVDSLRQLMVEMKCVDPDDPSLAQLTPDHTLGLWRGYFRAPMEWSPPGIG